MLAVGGVHSAADGLWSSRRATAASRARVRHPAGPVQRALAAQAAPPLAAGGGGAVLAVHLVRVVALHVRLCGHRPAPPQPLAIRQPAVREAEARRAATPAHAQQRRLYHRGCRGHLHAAAPGGLRAQAQGRARPLGY